MYRLSRKTLPRLALLALATLWIAPAHAQQTRAALTTEVNTNLATGQPGGITALQLRTTVLDILNSIMPTAPVGAGNLACFSGTTGLLQDCGSLPTAPVLTWLATPSSANLRAALTDETGTGLAYFQGGDIGTPSAGVGTNITGVPVGTLAGMGAGCATFLGTPSSANLRGCITDETGTGLAVFGTSPNITTPTGIVKGDVGLGNVANVDTTNAANITSGSLPAARLSLGQLTNSLGADVALSSTGTYFDGPSVAQGSTGTWFASGTITALDTGGAANIFCKLWDGTTVISTSGVAANAANARVTIALSGFLAAPAGNLRISCNDPGLTTGVIKFNTTGLSKDSTISVFRIN